MMTLDGIGNLGHAAREFLRGEQSRSFGCRRHDKLDRRRPVAVENHDGVVVERLEDVVTQFPQPGDETEFFAVVEVFADHLRQHDRGYVREDSCSDYFAHGLFLPSVR